MRGLIIDLVRERRCVPHHATADGDRRARWGRGCPHAFVRRPR
jgi:hypothetical protein